MVDGGYSEKISEAISNRQSGDAAGHTIAGAIYNSLTMLCCGRQSSESLESDESDPGTPIRDLFSEKLENGGQILKNGFTGACFWTDAWIETWGHGFAEAMAPGESSQF